MASTGLKVTEVNPPHLRDDAIAGDMTLEEWEHTQKARQNWNSSCAKKTTAIKHCKWAKIGLWPHACGDKHPLELAVTRDDGNVDWAAIDSADWVDPELKNKFQFRVFCLYQNFFDAFRFLDIHKKGVMLFGGQKITASHSPSILQAMYHLPPSKSNFMPSTSMLIPWISRNCFGAWIVGEMALWITKNGANP
jgi:hypothetical protein